MFITVNIKKVLKIVAVVLAVFFLIVGGFTAYQSHFVSASSFHKTTIVLDAGHGGMDGGSVGVKTGVKESDLNLAIVKKLKSYLTKYGFNVVLTRSDENGLYDTFGRNYKLEDMEKRRNTILKSNANLVVSVHMNSYKDKRQRGIQAFYDNDTGTGKQLANILTETFLKNFDTAKKAPSFGDYYILKCTQNPSVLIECGFLSNEEDELLLSTDEYQQKVAYNIFYGIVKYFQQI